MDFPLTAVEVKFVRDIVYCIATNDRARLKELTNGKIAERDAFWDYVEGFKERIVDLPEDIAGHVRYLVMERGDLAIDVFMRTREKPRSDIILVLEKDAETGELTVEYIYRS